MKILVSGLLNIETTVSVREFPINYYPIDYPFFGVNSNVSGVGCNVAKALTALGDSAELISFLGNDEESERILRDLGKFGIQTDKILRKLKSTPVSVILFDTEGRRQVYCDLKDIQEQTADPQRLIDTLKYVDAAVLCNINFNRELIKTARKLGTLTATDVHVLGDINDDYNRDFMENANILFLSDERLPESPETFIRHIYERYHNEIIVIGMGAKGALLFDSSRQKISFVEAYRPKKIVNTVGAGDALFSSFLHFYTKCYDAEAALKRAVIFAGIKIGYNGASIGFCSENEVEKLVR